MLKQTPLFDCYKDYANIKLINYNGWELPLNFSKGVMTEHMAVRENAGLFDVSHMGEFVIKGKKSREFLNWLITNDLSNIYPGKAVYSPMCYPDGGTVDDVIIYCLDNENWLMVVNAANIHKDFDWISRENKWIKNNTEEISINNVSSQYAQIAIQGKMAEKMLQETISIDLKNIKRFHFIKDIRIADKNIILSRTGYTGDTGFEIYSDAQDAASIWNILMTNFSAAGLQPCGLGARDTLRIEAAYPLYGHELSETINPLEAGLQRFVKLEKKDFCGKQALLAKLQENRRLIGFCMIDKGVPRQEYNIFMDNEKIGQVTSGTKSPLLNQFIGMALININNRKPEEMIYIDIKGKQKKARIVTLPFYQINKYKDKKST